jgi:hypothetical protein
VWVLSVELTCCSGIAFRIEWLSVLVTRLGFNLSSQRCSGLHSTGCPSDCVVPLNRPLSLDEKIFARMHPNQHAGTGQRRLSPSDSVLSDSGTEPQAAQCANCLKPQSFTADDLHRYDSYVEYLLRAT